VARALAITSDAGACSLEGGALSTRPRAEGFFAVVALEHRCATRPERLILRYDLFFDVDPRHQGFARLDLGDGLVREFVFRERERTWDVTHPVSAAARAREYLEMGIVHIFTGYDHIVFLAGLLLLAGLSGERARPLGAAFGYTARIVTAFTLAHSLTLIAAALGLIGLPARLTESAIALSIVYIAVENLRDGPDRGRWRIGFAFGLVHGFGFASVLREVGLPRRGLVAALVSFNVGVEVGQLCIVAALLPLLHLAARRSAAGYRRVVLGWGSALIAALGTFWFFERALAVRLLGGALG
jgi:hypothetical protein